ncbi:MAG TPA: hypothetical protein VHB99_05510, partial [Pirellulales bacterium]|nr:hypothetical protein [Pirellulales bacterium]
PQAPPPQIKPELDAETTKQLDELRQALAQAAATEQQNANVGKELAGALMRAAEQAAQLQMLPTELVSEMRATQEAFERLAVKPMEALAADLQQAATPQQSDPDLNDLAQASHHIQDELEALAARLKALEKVRESMDTGLDKALAQFRQEMLKQQAAGTERGLEELHELLAALRQRLQNFEGRQAEMLDASQAAPDTMLSDLEKRQQGLERESDPPLDEARQLLAADARMTGDDAAFEMGDADQDEKDGENGDKNREMGEAPPLFEPALGGPRPKLDPRLADKRPAPKADAEAARPAARTQREELASRQFHRLEELNLSQQSLGTDMASLEALMEQLRQALGGAEESMRPDVVDPAAGPNEPPAEAQNLAGLLQSPELQEAMALAQRLKQAEEAMAQARSGQPQKAPAHTSRDTSLANLTPTATSGKIIEVELSKLDPQTRSLVLKMQPKLREELLQGMREQGPEAYRKFIEDYFKRLSEVKMN